MRNFVARARQRTAQLVSAARRATGRASRDRTLGPSVRHLMPWDGLGVSSPRARPPYAADVGTAYQRPSIVSTKRQPDIVFGTGLGPAK